MAYLHDLRVDTDRVIEHKDGHQRVLTPCGAIFDSSDTDDLTELSVACAILFDPHWSLSELTVLDRSDKVLKLQWETPPPPTKPARHLRLVATGRTT